jgi:hypothetical protein
MSRLRAFLFVFAAVLIGACSDTQPTAPTTDPDPSLSKQGPLKELKFVWLDAKAAAELERSADAEHAPLLCNFGGSGPECLRVFHRGTLIQRVFHRGIAQGTGCSQSIIRIAGIVRGRSNFVCHRRGDVLIANWFVNEFWRFGTRVQVDFTGAGARSPTGFVFTNYR